MSGVLRLHRPLEVTAQDCRIMVDIEARNAIIAMVLHLISAFKLPARPRRPQQPPTAGVPAAALELPSKLRPPSGHIERKRVALQSLAPSASMEAGGTLLRTLLQQQKVASSFPLSATTPVAETMMPHTLLESTKILKVLPSKVILFGSDLAGAAALLV
jgi:hypothetical protein